MSSEGASTLSTRTQRLQIALEATLGAIGEDTGLEDLLSLLVHSVCELSSEVEEHKSKVAAAITSCEHSAAAAADSAVSASRDSAAAAIAMSEAHKLPAASIEEAPRAAAEAPAPAPAPSIAPAQAPAAQPREEGAPAANGGEAEAAEQMALILESAHLAASEIIALLDDPPPLTHPKLGDEELKHGVSANQSDDFLSAAAWFEASHRKRPRISTLLSIANMRLKLGDGPLAAYLYAAILEHPTASAAEREMSARKLPLAEAQLEQIGGEIQPGRGEPHAANGGGGTSAPAFAVAAPAPSLAEGLSAAMPLVRSPEPSWLTHAEASLDHVVVPERVEGVAASSREEQLEAAVASLQARLSAQREESGKAVEASRQKDASLEQMLREVTQTMQAEMGRAAKLQELHDNKMSATRADAARLARELQSARRQAGAAPGGGGGGGGVSAGALEEPLMEALERLSVTMRAEMCVDAMLAVHGDAVSAAPHLLLPALIQLGQLNQQKEQLEGEAQALRVAQADAVRKLAASNAAAHAGVVGNAARRLHGSLPSRQELLAGAKSYLRRDRETGGDVESEIRGKDAEIAKLQDALAMMGGALPPGYEADLDAAYGSGGEGGAYGSGGEGGFSPSAASAMAAAPFADAPTAGGHRRTRSEGDEAMGSDDMSGSEQPAVASPAAAGGGSPVVTASTPQTSEPTPRNAKAVKYVDTLLGRANREKIPEEDGRQALEYFEAAKQSNSLDDYKAACSYFETSFLLNPKLTTLISTANMHLKLNNPTVAAEIYTRLLQNPSVPQREREVALRKLAMCETMLGEEEQQQPLVP